jgi:hypothetical protein
MAIPLTVRVFRNGEAVGIREFHRDIIKIGRLSSAHLCLEDERVSRIHAVIEIGGDGSLSVIDMGSAEGTYVNGRRVNKGALQSGDEIGLGATKLVVEVGVARETGAPAMASASAGPGAAGAGEPGGASASGGAADGAGVSAGIPAGGVGEPAMPAPGGSAVPAAAPGAGEPGFPVAASADGAGLAGAGPGAAVASAGAAGAVAIGRLQATGGVAATAAALAPPAPEAAASPSPAARPRLRALPDETGSLVLEVRVLWGDQALGVALFDREERVTIGPGKGAHFQVEGAHLPGDQFPLLRRDGEDWYLRYTERMDGELRRKKEVVRLSALAGRGLARPGDDGAMEVKVPAGGAAWVDLGHVRAEVAYRAKPKRAVVPLAERIDYRFLNLLLVFAFLTAGVVVAFENMAFDTDLKADDLFSNHARYTRLVLKPPEKKNPLLARLRSLEGPKGPGEMAARHRGEEGKMGKKDAPQRNTRSAPRGDPNDKDLVKNQGLLAMLGRGHAGLSTIFGSGGLGGDLQGAIGGITGTAVGDAHGFGGLGLKGTGSGGGGVGNTIGVGDIGTKGRGGGLGTYGTGVGGLGKKGSADVSIDSSEAVIMGSLDKELIRRVIQQHRSQIRYCYESELVRNPKLGGKVAVKFVITADGSVSSATTAQTTMHNSTVESCINSRVRSWKFPKPKGGGIVVVTYPFLFKQSGT